MPTPNACRSAWPGASPWCGPSRFLPISCSWTSRSSRYEPTAERLRVLLLEIWQARPTTILFVTHDTREAVRLADRVILLTPSPGSVQSIVAIETPRADRAAPEFADRIRRQIMQPMDSSA